jgi:MoaA/NifB/PqqE/SkfB family radical SAM enzyme
MEPMTKILSVGLEAGLSQKDLERATTRIIQTLPSSMSGDGESSARLLAGLEKNLTDNPMLVAWGLKVAAHASDTVWQRFVDNFVIGVVTERKSAVASTKEDLGYHPPVTLVLNPTMRCNLRCNGCYAYSFNKNSDMDRPLLEKVLTEARELGIQFMTITGGEPFLYPDIEGVFEQFSDMIFMVYTNAQYIDSDRARRLSQLGNVWPAISVEGYQKETDARRGSGVYAKLTGAMERLRENGVLFGVSAVPTRQNTELLASDEFIDHYMEKGALFGWMFTYIPVGKDPDLDLMATPAQRDYLRRQSLHWRRTKPFFMADFWNDGPLCGGCMSANRFAFITNDGWAQPCTFVHFATHNVREHTLKEIFTSEFFRTIRGRQPYCSNLLRPCKVIDHPHILREVIEKCGARPVYPGAERIIEDPDIRSHLDDYGQEYKKLADKAWASSDYAAGYGVQVPFYGRVNLYEIYNWRLKPDTPPPASSSGKESRVSPDA